MPRDPSESYLSGIETAIQSLSDAIVEHYEEEFVSKERFNIRLRIRFSNGYLAEANEALRLAQGRITRLAYRYHFQDDKNRLIMRYDNRPHFPKLDRFPNHKHLPDRVIPTQETSIQEFLTEIQIFLSGIE